jgi:arylsulfatase A-like enzyme
VKGQVYEGGTLVPGLIEWPARIPQPRSTKARATTSDLLPTLCALTDQPLPNRPIDGMNLLPVLDGKMTNRPRPLWFWEFDTAHLGKGESYIDPKLQQGTTPLVKKSGGKATRDFNNFRHPTITAADYLGPRAIIDGPYKLVIHETPIGGVKKELFNLITDPAEKTNLLGKDPAIAKKLEIELRDWQQSVLYSLTGADYRK